MDIDLLVDDDLPGHMYRRGTMWWMAFRKNGRLVRLSTKKRHIDAAKQVWRQAANAIVAGADSAAAAKAAIYNNGSWLSAWSDTVEEAIKPGNWAHQIYRQSLQNAPTRNLSHDLTLDQYRCVLLRSGGYCELTGIPFDFVFKRGRLRPWLPSLDRKDCAQGYTFSNVRLVCAVVNLALSHFGDDVLERIAIGLLLRKHLHRGLHTYPTPAPEIEVSSLVSNT